MIAAPPRILREEVPLSPEGRTEVAFLDEILARWQSWAREADGVPPWSRFRPFEHPRLLPYLMVYERIGDRFRCAIVGDEATQALPVKLAGCFIDEAMPRENLPDITRRFDHALATGHPNYVEKTMAWHPEHGARTYRALQLPFTGGQGRNPRILSVMDFGF